MPRASVPDTTVKKVTSAYSPAGSMGQKYLVSGKRLSMRLWEELPDDSLRGEQESHVRQYETVGYVISGRAELYVADQKLILAAGDSWVVPKGAPHHYRILEPFTAVEATSPPAEVHSRDEH